MDRRTVRRESTESKKYSVAHSKKLGRYIIAAKNLSAGEVIFRENAAAVGPVTFETSVFCFACMSLLSARRANETLYRCSKCNVAPLCDKLCERKKKAMEGLSQLQNSISLHSAKECSTFRGKKDLYSENQEELARILLHLRLWFLREENPDIWDEIISMEAHLDKRRNTPVWDDREKNVVEVFRKFGELEGPSEKEKEEEKEDDTLQRLCGVVDVNTFELRAPGGRSPSAGGPLLRGLFPRAALMAHDCRPTGHVSVDGRFCMAVHAAVPLRAGDPVTFNYTSSLLGTVERQEHLQEGKYFRCDCTTCRDPLENGSYLSCILCPRCRKDYVAMQKPRASDPYGRGTKWQCQKCKRTFRGCLIKSTIEISKNLIGRTDHGNMGAMENVLVKLSRTFHKNHFVMLSLKQQILDLYRKELKCINPRRNVLQKMLEICKEIIDVLDVVEPGISRLKGILTYEMHLPIAILANRNYSAREITAPVMLSQLEEAQEHLKRSLTMLLIEPADTPEGLLAKRALQEMRMLKQNVAYAHVLATTSAEPRMRRARKKRDRTKLSED